MKHFAAVVGGTVAIVWGSSFLLFALPRAILEHTQFHGAGFWRGAVASLFAPGTARLTALGLVLVVVGIALNLQIVFPDKFDMPQGRLGRVGLFWGVVAAGALSMVAVLTGIALSILGLS